MSPQEVEKPQEGEDERPGVAPVRAEDASFAPTRFGTLKYNVTTHWKVEERPHGQ